MTSIYLFRNFDASDSGISWQNDLAYYINEMLL